MHTATIDNKMKQKHFSLLPPLSEITTEQVTQKEDHIAIKSKQITNGFVGKSFGKLKDDSEKEIKHDDVNSIPLFIGASVFGLTEKLFGLVQIWRSWVRRAYFVLFLNYRQQSDIS